MFKTPEAAKAALDSLKSGATFDKIVAAEGKTQADTLLGTLAKDKMADKAVAEAAFALDANEVSPVVQGAFGPVLLRVTEIKPEVVKPLAEVAAEIRKDLALAEANRVLLDVHDSYEDSRAAGDTLREAAAKLKLKVVTVDAIDRTGLRPDGSIVKRPAGIARAAARLRSTTEAGVENPGHQHRRQRLRVLRGGGHHAGPRPHAGRGHARRWSPTGRRRKRQSGWPQRRPSSRSG